MPWNPETMKITPERVRELRRKPEETDPPKDLGRRALLMGGGAAAVLAGAGLAFRFSGEIADAVKGHESGRRHGRLRESNDFEPVGRRFSEENTVFSEHMRSDYVAREIENRYEDTQRFGGTTEFSSRYGIGEQNPIEFVRRHIYSATEGLPEWMRRQMPSVAPALLATESSFQNWDLETGAIRENPTSGVLGAGQFLPQTWRNIQNLLRRRGKLGENERLDLNSLEDIVTAIGAYFVDVYEHFKRDMTNHTSEGIALANIRRRVFGYQEGLEPNTPLNEEKKERFEKYFLFPAIVNSFNSGAPFFTEALLHFDNTYLHQNVEELRALAADNHAVYGTFLSVLKDSPSRRFRSEQVCYVPILFGMREKIDSAYPARR